MSTALTAKGLSTRIATRSDLYVLFRFATDNDVCDRHRNNGPKWCARKCLAVRTVTHNDFAWINSGRERDGAAVAFSGDTHVASRNVWLWRLTSPFSGATLAARPLQRAVGRLPGKWARTPSASTL